MRKTKFKNRICGTNAVDGATTTSKDWGFIPIPGKGGNTLNGEIPVKKSKDEKKED